MSHYSKHLIAPKISHLNYLCDSNFSNLLSFSWFQFSHKPQGNMHMKTFCQKREIRKISYDVENCMKFENCFRTNFSFSAVALVSGRGKFSEFYSRSRMLNVYFMGYKTPRRYTTVILAARSESEAEGSANEKSRMHEIKQKEFPKFPRE